MIDNTIVDPCPNQRKIDLTPSEGIAYVWPLTVRLTALSLYFKVTLGLILA